MSNLETGSDSTVDPVENNRRILAGYSREKLIRFVDDTCGDASFGAKRYGEPKKKPEDLTDQELRDFALAITQGI